MCEIKETNRTKSRTEKLTSETNIAEHKEKCESVDALLEFEIDNKKPKNNCEKCFYMNLEVHRGDLLGDVNNTRLNLYVDLNFAREWIKTKYCNIEVGIFDGELDLSFSGCKTDASRFEFAKQFGEVKSIRNTEYVTKKGQVSSQIKSASINNKSYLSASAQSDNIVKSESEIKVQDQYETTRRSITVKGGEKNTVWHFYCDALQGENIIEKNYSRTLLSKVMLDLQNNGATIQAKFIVPKNSIQFVRTESTLGIEKLAVIQSLIRNHLWKTRFNPLSEQECVIDWRIENGK